jgi:ubiquinone biosynthesis protein UbiJ
LIKLILSQGVEAIINQLLALNPVSQSLLENHQGKVLLLEISDIDQHFYLRFTSEKILLLSVYCDQPNAIIRGTSFSFLKQLKLTGFAQELSIQGDVEFAQDIQHLIKNFNFHSEDYLSFLAGDVMTHNLTQIRQKIKNSSETIKKRSLEDMIEYIQEEQHFVPTKEEVEDFYEDVAQLGHSIDVLEARWNRLQTKEGKT